MIKKLERELMAYRASGRDDVIHILAISSGRF